MAMVLSFYETADEHGFTQIGSRERSICVYLRVSVVTCSLSPNGAFPAISAPPRFAGLREDEISREAHAEYAEYAERKAK